LQNVRKIEPQAYYQARRENNERAGLPKLGTLAADGKQAEPLAAKVPSAQPSARANSGLDHQQPPGQIASAQADHQLPAAGGPGALSSHKSQSQQLEDENDAYNNHI